MNVIKSIRTRLGVSQAELGAGIGVTQGNVSFYEKGQTMPPDVARRLIEYAKGKGHTLSFDDIYALPESQRALVVNPEAPAASQAA